MERSKIAAAEAVATASISKRRNKRSGVMVNLGSGLMKRKMSAFASFLRLLSVVLGEMCGSQNVSPLTPALSPLRGEGEDEPRRGLRSLAQPCPGLREVN